MPHSAKDAKGGHFLLPLHNWMDSLEHVPVAVLGFLGSVVSWDYKPEISSPHKKVSGTALSQSRGNNYQLQSQVRVPAAGPSPALLCLYPPVGLAVLWPSPLC